MPGINDARKLFVHQLGEALNMERTTLSILKESERAAQQPELKQLFAHHREETEGQVANLEQAFSALGEEPAGHVCHGMDGMKKEGQDLIEKVAPELRDGALATAATHVEHYEIATYEGLRTAAEAMGQEDVVALLTENLEQDAAHAARGAAVGPAAVCARSAAGRRLTSTVDGRAAPHGPAENRQAIQRNPARARRSPFSSSASSLPQFCDEADPRRLTAKAFPACAL
jgi:ferritin-like metal-binding protein YciE